MGKKRMEKTPRTITIAVSLYETAKNLPTLRGEDPPPTPFPFRSLRLGHYSLLHVPRSAPQIPLGKRRHPPLLTVMDTVLLVIYFAYGTPAV